MPPGPGANQKRGRTRRATGAGAATGWAAFGAQGGNIVPCHRHTGRSEGMAQAGDRRRRANAAQARQGRKNRCGRSVRTG